MAEHTDAYRRYQEDEDYDLDAALKDGLTDDEYREILAEPVTRMGTPGYKALRAEFGITYDDGDAWGSTLAWWFAVAEILHHSGPSLVPASWKFRDAPAHEGMDRRAYLDFSADDDSYQDIEIGALMDSGTVTTDDLVAFGTVLTRYANLLKMAGKDY